MYSKRNRKTFWRDGFVEETKGAGNRPSIYDGWEYGMLVWCVEGKEEERTGLAYGE